MMGRLWTLAAGLCLGLVAATPHHAEAEPRVALVVGNSHYGQNLGTLPNPVNDAGLMAQALQQTGFQVIKVTDADQKKMKRAIADFGDKLANAGPTATGLFFYAGHGVQVQGQNYLIPVDADITKEADVNLEAVSSDDVMQQMEFAGSRVNIIILDACRNNPLTRSFRSADRGLAPINNVAQGTFVAYSTAPGAVAADGAGANSPYTKALASIIVKPGVGIEEAFRDVRGQVMKVTSNKQVPWDSSSLTAPFYFKTAAAQAPATSAPAPAKVAPAATSTSTQGRADLEATFWKSIQNSKNPDDYQAYLDQFPNGTFAGLARNRMASLGQGTPRTEPTTPAPQPVAAPVTPPPVEPTPEPPAASNEDSTPDTVEASSKKPSKKEFCDIIDDTKSGYSDTCRRNRVGKKHH
jgi:carboxyl-terminal processing protease